MRIGLYVDAYDVYYGARSHCGRCTSGWRWPDLPALAPGLINPHLWPDPSLARFVHCTADRDREGDPTSIADQATCIGALDHPPGGSRRRVQRTSPVGCRRGRPRDQPVTTSC